MSGWGGESSKESVQCGYCNYVGRKDNLAKHIKRIHVDKPFKWRRVSPSNQPAIQGFLKQPIDKGEGDVLDLDPPHAQDEAFKVGTKRHISGEPKYPGGARQVPSESEEKDPTDDVDTGTASTEEFHGDDLYRDIKSKDSNNNDERNIFVRGIVSDLREVGDSFMSMKTGFEKVLADMSSMMISKEDPKNIPNVEKADVSEVSDVEASTIYHCSNLEDKLRDNFSFDQDSGIFICQICLQQKTPPYRGAAVHKAGTFTIDLTAYQTSLALFPKNQPDSFRDLKKKLVKHILRSETHLKNLKVTEEREKETAEKERRNHSIGLSLGRLRYNDIKHGNSFLSFEDTIVTAHLNGTDTGDINNSRQFAKDITENIKEAMDDKLKEAISTPLEGTGRIRQIGVVSDKITPNKRTGHIIAAILPVPENPLSEHFLCPILLDVPHVKDHTADGLAAQMLDVLHQAGVDDSQVSGFGVDGQYIKMGVLPKLIGMIDIEEKDMDKLKGWILQTWEPAHNLNLADEEVRGRQDFQWLVRFTNIIKEVTGLLNIGKGLEQMLDAAKELDMKSYRLQGYCSTRFAAYFEVSLNNFIKSYPIIIRALGERKTSKEKKVRDQAEKLLGQLLDVKFVGSLLGSRDIYCIIATASCQLQKVEQFPWEVTQILKSVIAKLSAMADNLHIDHHQGDDPDHDQVPAVLHDWDNLSCHLDDLKKGIFLSMAVGSAPERRQGRIRDYLGHQDDFTTIKNRLSSLASAQAKIIKKRTLDNKDCPFPPILDSMCNCLDLSLLLDESKSLDFIEELYGVESFNVMVEASLVENTTSIQHQYLVFKQRVLELLSDKGGKFDQIHGENEHLLWETHKCTLECNVKRQSQCQNYQKLVEPKKVKTMKVLHLFLKTPELYDGLHDFLHLYVSVATKTHAEGVAESMGNFVEIHSEKKRGLDISDVGVEAYINWNGPPVANASPLLETALDKRFKGRSNWRFVTKENKLQSKVVSRLKKEVSRVPFFE